MLCLCKIRRDLLLAGIASNMSPEIAEHFLRSLLNFASQFFETVDNMKEFLAPLVSEEFS